MAEKLEKTGEEETGTVRIFDTKYETVRSKGSH